MMPYQIFFLWAREFFLEGKKKISVWAGLLFCHSCPEKTGVFFRAMLYNLHVSGGILSYRVHFKNYHHRY